MKNQTITPMAALRSGTAASFGAVSFAVPADLPAAWPTGLATAGHVSAGLAGVGVNVMPTNLASVITADPVFRPAVVGTAKQDRPPRGIPR